MFQQPVDGIPPRDCPFCDEWAQKIEVDNANLVTENIVVSPIQFRNHVASHMEQLALFALPVSTVDEDNEDEIASKASISNSDIDTIKYVCPFLLCIRLF